MRKEDSFKDSGKMRYRLCFKHVLIVTSCLVIGTSSAFAQNRPSQQEDPPLGPVVTAYLGYLKNEQEVVDDRASRREISREYYRRNSNRIRALRETAIRIARETGNDYLPELEAVNNDELGTLFEHPPNISTVPIGKILNNTFRFLGPVRSGDMFYVFARLDPYEQAELKAKNPASADPQPRPTKPNPNATRPRRAIKP